MALREGIFAILAYFIQLENTQYNSELSQLHVTLQFQITVLKLYSVLKPNWSQKQNKNLVKSFLVLIVFDSTEQIKYKATGNASVKQWQPQHESLNCRHFRKRSKLRSAGQWKAFTITSVGPVYWKSPQCCSWWIQVKDFGGFMWCKPIVQWSAPLSWLDMVVPGDPSELLLCTAELDVLLNIM